MTVDARARKKWREICIVMSAEMRTVRLFKQFILFMFILCKRRKKATTKKHFRPEKIVEKLTKSKDCIVVPKVIHPFNVMFIKLVLPLRFLLSVLFTVIIYYWHARRKKNAYTPNLTQSLSTLLIDDIDCKYVVIIRRVYLNIKWTIGYNELLTFLTVGNDDLCSFYSLFLLLTVFRSSILFGRHSHCKCLMSF